MNSLVTIFDRIDTMLLSGQFEECDSLLLEMSSDGTSAELLTVLTATLAAKDKLPHREDFFHRAQVVLHSRHGVNAESLLRGLE